MKQRVKNRKNKNDYPELTDKDIEIYQALLKQQEEVVYEDN